MAEYENKGRAQAKSGSKITIEFTFYFRPVFVLFVNGQNMLDSSQSKNKVRFTLHNDTTLRWVVFPTGSGDKDGLYEVEIKIDGQTVTKVTNAEKKESRQEFIIECQEEEGGER